MWQCWNADRCCEFNEEVREGLLDGIHGSLMVYDSV